MPAIDPKEWDKRAQRDMRVDQLADSRRLEMSDGLTEAMRELKESWHDHAPPMFTKHEQTLKLNSAEAFLNVAASHMRSRAVQYDSPVGERSMGKAVAAFNAITGQDLTEPQGWLLMQVLKDVRLFQRGGYHADSAEDCIAYAALKAEAMAR